MSILQFIFFLRPHLPMSRGDILKLISHPRAANRTVHLTIFYLFAYVILFPSMLQSYGVVVYWAAVNLTVLTVLYVISGLAFTMRRMARRWHGAAGVTEPDITRGSWLERASR